MEVLRGADVADDDFAAMQGDAEAEQFSDFRGESFAQGGEAVDEREGGAEGAIVGIGLLRGIALAVVKPASFRCW